MHLEFYNQPPFRGDLPVDTRGDLGIMSTNFSLSSGLCEPFFGLNAGFNRDFIVLVSVGGESVDSVPVFLDGELDGILVLAGLEDIVDGASMNINKRYNSFQN